MNHVEGLSSPGMSEFVPLHYVPAETLFAAEGFETAPIPPGTTVVRGHNPYWPATDWVNSSRVLDMVATKRNVKHRRSYELSWPGQPEDMDVTVKGADWSNPSIMYAFRLRNTQFMGGLQYEDAEAALEAGATLDAAGIYGERLVRIDAPQALPLNNELHEPGYVIREIVDPYPFMRASLEEVLRRDTHRPVVAIRTAPTDVRLWDFRSDTPSSQLYDYLEEGMRRVGEVNSDYEGMNPLEPGDVRAFFMRALPDVYGNQMGKLEASGLRQRYPHPGNIAIDGGLIDLDGIQPNRKNRMNRYADWFVAGVKSAQEVLASRHLTPSPRTSHDLTVFSEFKRAFKQGKRHIV